MTNLDYVKRAFFGLSGGRMMQDTASTNSKFLSLMALITALWLLLATQALATEVSSEELHGDCGVCHGTAGANTDGALLAPEPELCLQCHADNADHIILVRPVTMSTALPLSNGLMTCVTCHDHHSSQALQLRLPPTELCTACHEI